MKVKIEGRRAFIFNLKIRKKDRERYGYYSKNKCTVSQDDQKAKKHRGLPAGISGGYRLYYAGPAEQKTASSELTLLRFCQKLGYANFLEMKNAFREYTQNMVKLLSSPQYFVPDATITDENGKSELLREICKEESEACKKFFSLLDLLAIISAAEAIRRSKRIFICAHDISHVLAEFLAARLKLLYFDPQIIDLSSLNDTQEKLEAMTPEDLVIFIAFPKYYYPLGSIAKTPSRAGHSC